MKAVNIGSESFQKTKKFLYILLLIIITIIIVKRIQDKNISTDNSVSTNKIN